MTEIVINLPTRPSDVINSRLIVASLSFDEGPDREIVSCRVVLLYSTLHHKNGGGETCTMFSTCRKYHCHSH